MRQQCIERDAERFTAVDNAESVVRDDEEGGCVALKTAGKYSKDGEQDAADELEGNFKGGVGQEESFNTVDAVGEVAVEHIALERVNRDVVEHCS